MNFFSSYYKKDLSKFFKSIIPKNESMLMLYNHISLPKSGKYNYILLPNTLAFTDDIQSFSQDLRKYANSKSRVVIISFNFLWKPFLDLATSIGLRSKDPREPNWLTFEDVENLFTLEGWEKIKQGRRLLIPLDLGPISSVINDFIGQLPLINSLCLSQYQIYKIKPIPKEYSVSIIIPARNEAGHMKGVLNKIPKLGCSTEVIFIEGNSKDNTYHVIEEEIKRFKDKNITTYLYKQKGRGKGDAVRLGFNKAKNEVLMILDADLTVPPQDLRKFYNAISQGHGDFINGSRLVYPMEKQAMRNLNYIGNKLFSMIFTYLLGQKVKDTLCGTKVLLKEDYEKIKANRKFFGDFDPFGDFDLLFGATKLNMKIIEIPIRYRERQYGETNISRFSHGLLLLKMTLFAARKLKFV